MSRNRLRSILQVSAILVLAAVAVTWAATGAHRGWTKTQITEMHRDEVTGIDYPVHRDGFVAGVDFLAAGIAGAVVLAAGSLLIRRRESSA